jgi:hypothetical protein
VSMMPDKHSSTLSTSTKTTSIRNSQKNHKRTFRSTMICSLFWISVRTSALTSMDP